MMKRLRQELLDLVELVLLPGLAALLPWKIAYRAFQHIARWKWLYREPCEQALLQARVRGWAGDNEAHWLWVRRLVTLVDHADHYLGLFRSDRWMQGHLKVTGKWPDAGKSVLLTTFHWGAGYWGLRSAAAHKLYPHALVASLDSAAYQGRWVLLRYAKARNANVARTLRASTIDASLHLKQVVRAIRNEEPLLGVMDVPADAAIASIEVRVLGMNARVPRGLLRLSVDQQVPVVLYITGLDIATGTRTLSIESLGLHASVEALAEVLFQRLGEVIAQDSPAWHFWSISERFFSPPPQ